jgi:dienelactone hydrolase
MGHAIEWGPHSGSKGVWHRRFDVERDGHVVPGVLWEPEGNAARESQPLVLVGHGGSGHKAQDYVTAIARRMVRHLGFAVAAIDGPTHGDRRTDPETDAQLVMLEFSQQWSSVDSLTDLMVEDWRATLDALVEEGGFGGPVGYWGLSMGTIFGLPFVAAEPRVSVAALGLMGLTGPTRARIEADAPRVTCPVLFLAQCDDELFAFEKVCALFLALGSANKRLHAHPGRHSAVPVEEFAASEQFLSLHLGTTHP